MMPEPGDPRSSCSPAIYHMTAARGLGAWWKRSEERLPAPLSLAPPQLGEVEPGGGARKSHVRARSSFKTQGREKMPEQGGPLRPLALLALPQPLCPLPLPLAPHLSRSPGDTPGRGRRAGAGTRAAASCGPWELLIH